jgi:putative ABC transport system permease protein
MRLLRELGRRKVRTTLTVLGITIGIWTLVVFGSMANKINALVDGGGSYYTGKLTISDASGSGAGFGGAPMALETADLVRAVDGVAAVQPTVGITIDDATGGFAAMSIPPFISGETPDPAGFGTFRLTYAQGRALVPADDGSLVTVLGADLARKYDKHVGDTVTLRGETFTVIGILEPTLTVPDSEAIVPFGVAQNLYVAAQPPLIRAGLRAADLATTMVVFPAPGVDPDELAARIKNVVAGVATMTDTDFDRLAGSATAMLNAVLIGIGLISLVVGGLSVVNTMAMSIAERTREIGIKRAIGGGRVRIVRELVTEAGLIGLLGGVIGLALGALVVLAANEAGRSSGTVLFSLTSGTALTAVLFSTVLGALAGFVPAVHAARLDPVSALRYE